MHTCTSSFLDYLAKNYGTHQGNPNIIFMTISEGIMDNLIKSSAMKYLNDMIELFIPVFLNLVKPVGIESNKEILKCVL